MTRYYIGWLL